MAESDPFYRYSIDAPSLRYTGRNQSSMTVVENLALLGKQLSRPPALILVFLAETFHTRTEGEDKLRGRYTEKEVGAAIDKLRGLLICCRACGNPETTTRLHKTSGYLSLRCAACGEKSKVTSDEIPARVWRFMIREVK